MKRILRATLLLPFVFFMQPFHVGREGGPVCQDVSPFVIWFLTRYEHLEMRTLNYLATSDWIYRHGATKALVNWLRKRVVAVANGEVLTMGEAKEMLDSLFDGGYTVAVGTCPCRRALKKYSEDVPNETDMAFGPWAERYLRTYPDMYRKISYTEAVELIEEFDRFGLVHQVYGLKTLEGGGVVVCNCCSEVCVPLLAQQLRGFESFRKGRSRAVSDPEACLGVEECGTCIERCVFGARVSRDGKAHVDPDACFGCGLCVSPCRGQATKLERVPGAELIYAKHLVS